jgi:hypothetical protein
VPDQPAKREQRQDGNDAADQTAAGLHCWFRFGFFGCNWGIAVCFVNFCIHYLSLCAALAGPSGFYADTLLSGDLRAG